MSSRESVSILQPATARELYELATVAYRLVDVDEAKTGVERWLAAPEAGGTLLGCWEAENGELGRLHVLRAFADERQLADERRRTHISTSPFGAADVVTALSQVSYAPFPFLPAVEPGHYGKVYEVRDYHLRPGGLPATLEGWQRAVPERVRLSPLTIAMYALDGPARITHIWPYPGLDARVAIRRESYDRGIWPPPGAPEQILKATSTICFPTSFSPLA
jgi:hypothetical protein